LVNSVTAIIAGVELSRKSPDVGFAHTLTLSFMNLFDGLLKSSLQRLRESQFQRNDWPERAQTVKPFREVIKE
jgi:hypothetical protein